MTSTSMWVWLLLSHYYDVTDTRYRSDISQSQKNLDASLLESLKKEPSDLVQMDYIHDKYENLVYKSMNVFWYAYDNCYTSVLKVDDE